MHLAGMYPAILTLNWIAAKHGERFMLAVRSTLTVHQTSHLLSVGKGRRRPRRNDAQIALGISTMRINWVYRLCRPKLCIGRRVGSTVHGCVRYRPSTTSTTSTSILGSSVSTSASMLTSTPASESTQTIEPTPAATSLPSSGTNVGAIAGGVVGGVAGVAIIAGSIRYFLLWQFRTSQNNGSATPLCGLQTSQMVTTMKSEITRTSARPPNYQYIHRLEPSASLRLSLIFRTSRSSRL
ncbi:hypothetical protein IFM46972_01183 [Aspergillus udagawae]|uniref:Uncharacterized protein n=1 Tax=Aspergillus udagawae TaxID=91492 RepID=A0A8H3N540_9EURO|nr:hypothetical protein IFM46972_01183 [Aspergillus udagawae]